jgi:hypothetical protein
MRADRLTRLPPKLFEVTNGTGAGDLRLRRATDEGRLCAYTAVGVVPSPSDLRSFTLRTDLPIEPTAPARSRPQELPVIAWGGVTLAAVLNVLHQGGIPCYALCPQTDFVRRSRWYRALPTALPNPRPPDLEALLESLEIESGVLLPCSDDWLRAVATLPASLASRFPSSTGFTKHPLYRASN